MTRTTPSLAMCLALSALGAGCASGEIGDDALAYCAPGAAACGPRGAGGSGGLGSAGGSAGFDRGPRRVRDAAGDAVGPDGGSRTDAEASTDGAPAPPGDDFDRDGVPAPRDCDDRDARRYPGAPELPGDQLDSDCDGQDDQACASHDDCPPAYYCEYPGRTCQFGCRDGDCRPGLRCHTLDRACVPERGACSRDGDCRDGAVCALSPIPGTDAVNGQCRIPLGDTPGGAPCRESEACRSGFCVYGQYCLALCVNDADCGEGTSCGWIRVRLGDTDSRVRSCLGPLRGCQRGAECGDEASCAPIPRESAPRGFRLACVPGGPVGEGRSGAPCQTGEDCQSGACLDDGRCFGLCVDDGDCHTGTRCYSPGVFIVDDGATDTPSDDMNVGLSSCLPDVGSTQDCSGGAPCPQGEVCGIWRAVDGRRFEPRCLTAVGPRRAGSPCGSDEECQSGSCQRERCFGVCAADADCADGTRCVVGRYVFDTQGTPDLHDDAFGELGLCVP